MFRTSFKQEVSAITLYKAHHKNYQKNIKMFVYVEKVLRFR